MTEISANPISTNIPAVDPARCQKRFANGTRCRSLVLDTDTGLCPRHAKSQHQRNQSADLTPILIGDLTEFTSAAVVNKVLSQLLILLAGNRISPRHAAVIAYVTNQLLSTVREINREAKNTPVEIIWDIPRPQRD